MMRKPLSPRLAASSRPRAASRRSRQAVAEPGSWVARCATSRASTAVRGCAAAAAAGAAGAGPASASPAAAPLLRLVLLLASADVAATTAGFCCSVSQASKCCRAVAMKDLL
jgi:hypothetical protein